MKTGVQDRFLNLNKEDVDILPFDAQDIEYNGSTKEIKEAIIILRGLIKEQEIGLAMIKRNLKILEEKL